jgi:SRSO17 transposase
MSEQNNQHYQKQHHFLSDSPWSAQLLMQKISLDTNVMLGDYSQQCLSIDESSNAKAGKHSVGVSRQHNGNLGKIDNCQTGVYATLCSGNVVGLINTRLFLPDEWVNNSKRCQKAGVPKEAIVKKTKIDLALDMIRESLSVGVRFGWINADGLYGSSYTFCNTIEDLGQNFMVDIHKDQMVYLTEPHVFLPKLKTKIGRPTNRFKANEKTVRVDNYLEGLTDNDFKRVKIRKGTKGWIMGDIHLMEVWVWHWEGKDAQPRKRTLMIRKGLKKGDPVKFCLCNIGINERTHQEFAFMQAQRHWVERAFEDGKGELGMADYQVRKYNAWYHHQALVMLAMQYVNKKKTELKKDLPLLSVRDVRINIIATLKEQGAQMEKEIDQMFERHRQRLDDINRYYPDNEHL